MTPDLLYIYIHCLPLDRFQRCKPCSLALRVSTPKLCSSWIFLAGLCCLLCLLYLTLLSFPIFHSFFILFAEVKMPGLCASAALGAVSIAVTASGKQTAELGHCHWISLLRFRHPSNYANLCRSAR